MDDPAKVLNQLSSYASEGRLEIAEVMAEELSDHLRAIKDGQLPTQELLVQALRQHSMILSQRSKWKLALKSAKSFSKEAAILEKLRSKSGWQPTQDELRLQISDSLMVARIHLHLGSLSKMMKSLSNPLRLGNIDAHLLAIHGYEVGKGSLKGASKPVKSLIRTLQATAPPSRSTSGLVLISKDGTETSADDVLNSLSRWTAAGSGMKSTLANDLKQRLDALQSQVLSIQRGESEANAKLQAAINSLQPAVDYHEYSKSSR